MNSRRSFIQRISAFCLSLCFWRKAVTKEEIGVEDIPLPNSGKFALSKAKRTLLDWETIPETAATSMVGLMCSGDAPLVSPKTHPNLFSERESHLAFTNPMPPEEIHGSFAEIISKECEL